MLESIQKQKPLLPRDKVADVDAPPKMQSDDYEVYCKPHLARLLDSLKLCRTFHRASGNYLYEFRDGVETAVLDCLGGYGSTLLGHNHPVLTDTMIHALQNGVVVHGQLSNRRESGLVGKQLNQMLARDGGSETFIVCLLNSGAEAVEASLKHAYIAWNKQKSKAIFRLKKRLINLQECEFDQETTFLIRDLTETLARIQEARPIIFAMEGSFHGKTLGALSVTANETYRKMFQRAGLEVQFLKSSMAKEDLEKIFADASIDVPDFKPFCSVAAVIVEVIQGEGGVIPLPMCFLSDLSSICRRRSVPKIVDEIQTGLYRTGSLLASSSRGFEADYILFGKILGGGLAKVAAAAFRSSVYDEDFELKHSSTFADDGPSSLVAYRTLQILDAARDDLGRDAKNFESSFRKSLDAIAIRYPGAIEDVRGCGFLVGIEFAETLPSEPSNFYQALVESGYLGYVYASYLLHEHKIRVAPTLSQPHTIRIEPPASITNTELQNLVRGIEDLVSVIYSGEILRLTAHIFEMTEIPRKISVAKPTTSLPLKKDSEHPTVCFLSHVVDHNQLPDMDPVFGELSKEQREFFFDEFAESVKPIQYHDQIIAGDNGRSVRFVLLGLPLPSRFFEQQLRSGGYAAFEKISQAVKKARDLNATHIGLGQYTSILSMNGQLLSDEGVRVTTGNSLTVGLAYRGLLKVCLDRGIDIDSCRIGVVGAAGNIGSVLAQMLADHAASMVLIHRVGAEQSPKFAAIGDRIVKESHLTGDRVKLSSSLQDLRDCDLVVMSTNATEPLVLQECLKNGACVLDVSVPANVPLSLAKVRPDLTLLQGGFACLPGEQVFLNPIIPAPSGQVFACMAETIMTGLLDVKEHFSFGNLSKERVLQSLELAESVGIRLGSLKTPDMDCRW